MGKQLTDEQVIEAIIKKDRATINVAMNFFYHDFFPTIRGYICQNKGTPEEANDIFQDALTVMYVKIRKEQYSGAGSLKSFVYGVSKKLWLKELRRRRVVAKNEPALKVLADFQEEMSIQESQMTLNNLLNQIDAECKALLIDFYFEGNSVKELTGKYGLGSDAATKNKKYRCLKKLIQLVRHSRLEKSDISYE